MKLMEKFNVIHPLDDVVEEKFKGENLGLIKLSRSGKFCLMALRVYLIIMTILLCYHLICLAHH